MSVAPSSITEPAGRAQPGPVSVLECLDTAAVVHLFGELDLSTLDEQAQTMARAIALELPLVVDLSGVAFIDATTISLLLRSADHLQARARSFTLRSPSQVAARLLTICGLDDLVADHIPHLVAVDRAGP